MTVILECSLFDIVHLSSSRISASSWHDLQQGLRSKRRHRQRQKWHWQRCCVRNADDMLILSR